MQCVAAFGRAPHGPGMVPARPQALSPAVSALGMGGALSDQVKDETEEERRKRLQQQQERSLMGPAGSPATLSLFGGMGGTGL